MSENVNQRLQETIAQLYENAPGFRRRMDNAGVEPGQIQTAADLGRLPILRKDDLIVQQRQFPPFGDMLAVPVSELRRVFQSPGPLNEPDPRGGADYGRWAPALQAAGFEPGEVVLNAFGYHLTPAGASLEEALSTVGCVVIPGGIGNQEQQIQAMVSFGATGYVGLPSYLKALIDKAQELGQTLALRKAFVLAEPLPPSLRQALNDHGIAVYQAYGTAECGNLGYECQEISGWHVPEGVIVQICDINSGHPLPPGETGEVVATLLNTPYAIIRFGVGDLSSFNDEPCPCGRSSWRLNGWQGRIGEAVKVRGMFLHPRQLAGVIARFPEVTAYQAVITRQAHKDELTLQVALQEGTNAAEVADRLKAVSREAIKFRLDVDVVAAQAIPSDSPPIRDERTWD